MGAAEADADVCPECQATNPWVYENDEYNCRHCGHVRTGSLAAKFRDEGEYVQPLTEIYLKNPAYRDKLQGSASGPSSAHVQKAESDLYRQLFGCVRNTLHLPELVAHRAWNILELVRKRLSRKNITPAVRNLAMSVALVAAREAGHQVSDLAISAMIGKNLVYVQNDVRLICKTLERPYADYRGINEFALKVIRLAEGIARTFLDTTDLGEDITKDKYFKNTRDFCAAYQPRLDTVKDIAERVERLAEITGVWQNRNADYCTIAAVFIALEMAGGTFHHQTRLFSEQLRKHVFFNGASWLPRTRELQRVAMDLAFYLPQIGKARVLPELVEPWRGRTTRPIPIGQVFILLLPDVLDNMDALWEKRQQDMDREKETDPKRDVEARLKEALSAFLPPLADVPPSTTDGCPSDRGISANTSRRATPTPAASSTSEPINSFRTPTATRNGLIEQAIPSVDRCASAPPCRERCIDSASSKHTGVQEHSRSTSLPPDATRRNVVDGITRKTFNVSDTEGPALSPDGSVSASGELTLPKKRKRKTQGDDSGNKRPDKRFRENRVKDPAEERRVQAEMRERFEKHLTAKQVGDRSRQQTQLERGIGVRNPEYMKSGRLVYGRRRHGLYDTGCFIRLPSVLRLLKEWQARESASQAARPENANFSSQNRSKDDAWHLRRDLRNGRDPLTIPAFRFPTSLTMAKSMLNDTDVDCPVIGPDDDLYFDEGELDGYLGDEHFQKARMELWDAQGLDKYIQKETIYRERAFEIASKRDPRVAGLKAVKPDHMEKMNSARLAEVMESFRENSEPMMEIDPILRKEFGRNLAYAAIQAGGVRVEDNYEYGKEDDYGEKSDYGDKDDYGEKNDYGEKYDYRDKDDYGDDSLDEEAGKENDDGVYAPPMDPTNDDAFEVVGDLYDFDVSGYAGYDRYSESGDF